MNTPSQQALAAFIDSASLKKEARFAPKYSTAGTDVPWLEGAVLTASELLRHGMEIRLGSGQLNEFGIPHSLAHLAHNPAGLTAKQITEGGTWRVVLLKDSPKSKGLQYWSNSINNWTPVCFAAETIEDSKLALKVTCRLPALHPLPKVESENPKLSEPCPKCGRGYKGIILSDAEIDLDTGEIIDTPPQAEVKQSETPRTDAAEQRQKQINQGIPDSEWPWKAIQSGWEFARTLERELTTERKRAEDAEAHNVVLREALEAYKRAGVGNSTDYILQVQALDLAHKALSAQPPAVKERSRKQFRCPQCEKGVLHPCVAPMEEVN